MLIFHCHTCNAHHESPVPVIMERTWTEHGINHPGHRCVLVSVEEKEPEIDMVKYATDIAAGMGRGR